VWAWEIRRNITSTRIKVAKFEVVDSAQEKKGKKKQMDIPVTLLRKKKHICNVRVNARSTNIQRFFQQLPPFLSLTAPGTSFLQ
jgi:hypothetical protein